MASSDRLSSAKEDLTPEVSNVLSPELLYGLDFRPAVLIGTQRLSFVVRGRVIEGLSTGGPLIRSDSVTDSIEPFAVSNVTSSHRVRLSVRQAPLSEDLEDVKEGVND